MVVVERWSVAVKSACAVRLNFSSEHILRSYHPPAHFVDTRNKETVSDGFDIVIVVCRLHLAKPLPADGGQDGPPSPQFGCYDVDWKSITDG